MGVACSPFVAELRSKNYAKSFPNLYLKNNYPNQKSTTPTYINKNDPFTIK